jgi:PDZ domain-containing protein
MKEKDRKLLVTIMFAVIYIIIAFFVPTNFSVTIPGEINKVEDNIKIEGVENSSNFYTISVYYMTRITPITRMVLELSSKNDVETMSKYSKSISNLDEFETGQVSKKYSYYSSLINAYQEAGKIDNSIVIDYEINSLVLYYRPSQLKELEIGDIITKINGQEMNKDNYREVLLNAIDDEVIFEVKRGEKQFTYIHKGEHALSFLPNINIISKSPSFNLPGEDSNTGGPSGGLMQALNIYASLLNLNFGNLKIAGTGTLNLEGKVGAIGGAAQKIHTANSAQIDIFFMALENDKEVRKIEKKFEYYTVETFAEAITILMTKIIE